MCNYNDCICLWIFSFESVENNVSSLENFTFGKNKDLKIAKKNFKPLIY